MHDVNGVFNFNLPSLQIPNYRGDKHREEVIDRPAAWEEVVFKCVPLQEGEEDAHEVLILHTFAHTYVPAQYSTHRDMHTQYEYVH